MLYTVEIDFSNPDKEAEWSAWYNSNLPLIVTVPGFKTAQRFEKAGKHGYRFLAAYNITSLEVFESERYRAIGGGGQASSQWREWITRRRNVQTGVDWFPPVSNCGRILLTELSPEALDLSGILFVPITAIALSRLPLHRNIAITTSGMIAEHGLTDREGVAVYAPMAQQQVSPA